MKKKKEDENILMSFPWKKKDSIEKKEGKHTPIIFNV